MSCRFDDFPVGQANIAFRADAAKIFGPLTTSTLYGSQAVSTSVNQNEVDEDIQALYAQFGLQSELLGRDVRITGGLRYETTKVDSTAAQAVPQRIRWLADNDFVIDFAPGSTAVTGRWPLQPLPAEHRHQDGRHGQGCGAHCRTARPSVAFRTAACSRRRPRRLRTTRRRSAV
jgi:hypothetical protein